MVREWLTRHMWPSIAVILAVIASVAGPLAQVRQGTRDTAVHARKPSRLLIRRAMVIYGNGKPPYGPMDILVAGRRHRQHRAQRARGEADAVIDATGKYVMPGLVDTHMHWHDERAGVPMPIQYERNLYLAAGVTLTRENRRQLRQDASGGSAESAAAPGRRPAHAGLLAPGVARRRHGRRHQRRRP